MPFVPVTESATERQMRLHRERMQQDPQRQTANLGNNVLGGIVAGVALNSMLD